MVLVKVGSERPFCVSIARDLITFARCNTNDNPLHTSQTGKSEHGLVGAVAELQMVRPQSRVLMKAHLQLLNHCHLHGCSFVRTRSAGSDTESDPTNQAIQITRKSFRSS